MILRVPIIKKNTKIYISWVQLLKWCIFFDFNTCALQFLIYLVSIQLTHIMFLCKYDYFLALLLSITFVFISFPLILLTIMTTFNIFFFLLTLQKIPNVHTAPLISYITFKSPSLSYKYTTNLMGFTGHFNSETTLKYCFCCWNWSDTQVLTNIR